MSGCSFAGVQMKCYGYGGGENYSTRVVWTTWCFLSFLEFDSFSPQSLSLMEKGRLVVLRKKENQKIWVLNIMRKSRWQDHFWENYSLKDISVWKKKKLIKMSSIAFRVALSETRAPLNSQSKPVPAYKFSVYSHSRDDDDSWHSKAKLSLQKVWSCIQNTDYTSSL